MTSKTSALLDDLRRAGYYPDLVADVVDVALADEVHHAHYVHLETTFVGTEVRRHLTVLALTDSRLIVTHVDDQIPGEQSTESNALATSEAVPLSQVKTVALTHEYARPEKHRRGSTPATLVVAIGWNAVQRLELEPATCGDPECEADHGFSGTMSPDDVMIRVSGEAEGPGAVRSAVAFARALSTATAQAL